MKFSAPVKATALGSILLSSGFLAGCSGISGQEPINIETDVITFDEMQERLNDRELIAEEEQQGNISEDILKDLESNVQKLGAVDAKREAQLQHYISKIEITDKLFDAGEVLYHLTAAKSFERPCDILAISFQSESFELRYNIVPALQDMFSNATAQQLSAMGIMSEQERQESLEDLNELSAMSSLELTAGAKYVQTYNCSI